MSPPRAPWIVLHNPRSRQGRRAARRVRVVAERSPVESARHLQWVSLQELASLETRPERLLVLGGDGTVNATVTLLFEKQWDTPIAVLPSGTGNNLARGLNLPLDPVQAFRIAVTAEGTRGLDAVLFSSRGDEFDRRLMVQTAALGFPAEIAARYDALRQRPWFRTLFAPLGPHVYRLLALVGLSDQKRREREGRDLLEARVQLPDEQLDETVLAVFIGNDRSLGGNFLPCPRAAVGDGLVDLCLVRAGTGTSYLRFFQKVISGRHLDLEDVVVYRQTPGPVKIQLSRSGPLLIDGDIHFETASFEVDVLPQRFQVFATGPD